MKKPTRIYRYRGPIERVAKGRPGQYRWVEGWSPDGSVPGSILYGWSTRRECQEEARRDGVRAVFVREAT